MTLFLAFIGVIVIVVLVFNLRGRVQKLEQYIRDGATEHMPEPSYQPQPQQPTTTPIQPAAPSAQIGSTWFDKFAEWIKEDWMLKLGALLLLIGFGWLATYAFLNNWIGPMGRIVLGIVAGAMFLLLGWWRIKTYAHQGGIFLVLGSTTILMTIFAAREIYDFFTPFSALVVMFLSTAFVALASVKCNNRPLALASLILAGIAPLLTNAPTTNYVGLFSYLFIVILGAIWITVLTGRRELTTVALLLVTFYSLPHLLSANSSSLPRLFPSSSADAGILLLFAYAFAAVFFLTNTVGILKLKDKEIIPDLVTAAGSGLFLLSWIMVAAQDEWKSLIISAWMIVFAVGAFLIFWITQRREPFYVYAGIGIAMLAAATSAELRGATLMIAYAVESSLISLVAYLILKDVRIAERISLLLIGPIIFSFGSITSRAWVTSVLHKDFFVLLVLGLALLGLGLFFLRRVRKVTEEEPKQLNMLLLIAGSLYAYALVWLSLQATLRNDNTAVMISLVAYTIVGLICYFYGLANGKKSLRIYGGALIGFVVGRLLLVDVWKMELAGRIVTFFLIGALLVSTAFWGKKRRKIDLPNNPQ